MMYVPEGYYPGEFGGPIWGLWSREREDAYVITMVTWGSFSNLIMLFIITLVIEIAGKRSLYLCLFGGIFGFVAAEVIGVIIGLFVGVFIALFVMFKLRQGLMHFWDFLWE